MSEGAPIALTPSLAGRLQRLTHPGEVRSEVSRDGAGRVTGIAHRLGAGLLLLLGYTLDANGHRVAEVWERSGERVETSYQLDLAERLQAITVGGRRVQYSLDAKGNRIREESPGEILEHRYDARDRLTSTLRNGEPHSTSTFDAAGRQTRSSQGGIDTHYVYNAEDRLLEVSRSGQPTLRYEIDAFGQRRQREAAGAIERYHWDGTRLASISNAVGNRLADYQHVGGWVVSGREGAPRHSILTDVHGTPQVLLTPSGAIAGHTRSDVWGSEQSQSGTQTRIGHTGYLKDPILVDQLHAQARQYTPTLGRFTTRDPWTGDRNNPITLNKYLAFNGNPGSYLDPDGKYSRPGHYYTGLVTAIRAGYSPTEALRIAYYAQVPDEVGRYDAINVMTSTGLGMVGDLFGVDTPFERDPVFSPLEIQKSLHVLNGENSLINTAITRRMILQAPNLEQVGLAVHALGDSFAHRQIDNEEYNYPPVLGHLRDMTRPDMIAYRPELYGQYVKMLVQTLAERRGKPISDNEAQDFADSMVAMTDEPMRLLEERVKPFAQDLFEKQRNVEAESPGSNEYHAAQAALNRARVRLREKTDFFLGKAEGEILKSLVASSEKSAGGRFVENSDGTVAVLLSPEDNPMGHFEGTIGSDDENLARFFDKAIRPDEKKRIGSQTTIYRKDTDAKVLEMHVKGYLELSNRCWNEGAC